MTVWTADAPGSWTEGRPRVILFGTDGCSTGEQRLDNGCSAFERENVDVCTFDAPDVGAIDRFLLATDPSTAGACTLPAALLLMASISLFT